MPSVMSSDGVRLHVEDSGGHGRPLVMLHGWPCSGAFFDRAAADLSGVARVVRPDLRGFGRSAAPQHGYRVARLARDLHDVLEQLELREVTVLGWSLGCAVIWSHLELFGRDRLAQAVFVQQSPRQWWSPDWDLGHREIRDQQGLLDLQARVRADPAAFDEANMATLLHTRPSPHEHDRLMAEMALSRAHARNTVMADHTTQDWRDLLSLIDLPTLVLVAEQDPAFPADGVAWVGQAVPGARTEYFQDSAHALFLDEPDRFAQVMTGFLQEHPPPTDDL